MLAKTLELGAGVFLSAVIGRPKGEARVTRAPLLIGLDTEYRPDDQSLLSVQFCVRASDGSLQSRVYYPTSPKLSVGVFAALLTTFLQDVCVGVPRSRTVYFVSHFAQAELAGFEAPYRDWNIRQMNKAHQASMDVLAPDSKRLKFRLIDLFGYFATALALIGASVALPKLDVDPCKLEELLHCDRGAFEAYAVRDAEIALVAFERFRERILTEWRIDVLRSPTIAAVASEIFRRRFLQSYPCPVKSLPTVERRPAGDGYRKVHRTIVVFDGSADVRLMACRSYWGGRNEAFIHGLYIGPVTMRDVVSLYPHAALLQPLPTEKTKWEAVNNIDLVSSTEGFGHFTFEFPAGTMYPCLPAMREGIGRLMFPRKGETYCTFAEVRAALRMGARVVPVKAWGFPPTARERDHDIGRYMRHFLAKKAAEEKGSLEYETTKLLLNALVGKLHARLRGNDIISRERAAQHLGVSGVIRLFAKNAATRDAFQQGEVPGVTWAPEWSTLILGRSRALMAPIISRGALLVSTDAVLVPVDLSLQTDGLDDLERVGSGLVDEAVGDAAFVARDRMYAILRRVENLKLGDPFLARDERWAVIKVARHGSPETKPQFAATVLACLAAGRDVCQPVDKMRLLGASQAILADRPLNEPLVSTRQTHLRWNNKRALRDRDVNMFTSYTTTTPYVSLDKQEAAEHQRQVRSGEARRRRMERAPHVMDTVLAMLEEGASVRAIAAATGMPKSTVQDIRRRLFRDGKEAS